MSDEHDRTLLRRAAARPEPTSWNGISYDDMMRSLEDALPEDDRATLVGQLATRPMGFEPPPVTQRLPHVERRGATFETVTTIAPVAMNSPALDLERERHRNRKLHEKLGRVLARPTVDADGAIDAIDAIDATGAPRKRGGKGFVVGALLGALVGGVGFTFANADAHAFASAAASNVRTHASSWMSGAGAKSDAVAPAVAAPAVATPAVITPSGATPSGATPSGATPVAAPVAVPTMRAPTPPPARPARTTKAKRATSDDGKTPAMDADPAALLDRGLGD